MKLASLKNATRDGALIIVSHDLARFTPAADIAPTLQAALDDWRNRAPKLRARAHALANRTVAGVPFDLPAVASPLPRAYQWADGSAYVNHIELVRRARGAAVPDSVYTDPLMYQGGSDSFIAPGDDIPLASDAWGLDFEAEVAVITDDVPMGADAARAGDAIRLVMLVNDVSLRALIPAELGKGFGFFQSKPSSAFSPVAVTLDELGAHWRDYRLHLPLRVDYNGAPFGRANAGRDMTFNFAQLIAHAARTRPLAAGTIIGSGTVSNRQDGTPGAALEHGGVGYSCIAEVRMLETIHHGAPSTPFMRVTDRVRIEMQDENGGSIFGAIDQRVVAYTPPD